MGRDENVTVFKDTEKLCKTNTKLAGLSTKVCKFKNGDL